MAAAPVKLVNEVREILLAFSSFNVREVRDDMKLHRDLGINEDLGLAALAAPFQRISSAYQQAIVTREDCRALETVRECISLVATKAGFDYEGTR